MDYQIISILPTITSKASALSEYTYADTLSKGIKYNKNDVVIEFFRDAGCTEKVATWAENSGKFAVAYDDTANTMTIRMTDTGLAEINEAATVYTDSVKRGYSDCTMRITYAATLTSDAKMGDTDNPNTVTLIWKRTNTTYYDTLEDCCHVYTYGIDVLKQFSDGIRRLTPLECERLQGFPDGWTDIPGASESARYKALGNSVAIPCVDFVMKCMADTIRESEGEL